MIKMRSFTCGLVLAALLAPACGGSGETGSPPASPAPASASPASASTSPATTTVTVKENEYSIVPATLTLSPGAYTFKVQNDGQLPHDLHIGTSDGSELAASSVLRAGETGSFRVDLKAGAYQMWCAVDAHRSLGMQGTITVQ